MRPGLNPLMMHPSIEPVAAVVLMASSWIFAFSSNSPSRRAQPVR
jgi:hypothetical protein